MSKKAKEQSIDRMKDTEVIKTAQLAFDCFTQGLATGEWESFLSQLTDDFTFWFPVGAFKGTNIGKDKAAQFFQYVTEKVFTQGLAVTLNRVTSNDNTVVFEIESEGQMFGKPYKNQAAISFDVRGDKICGYREYLGVLFVLNQN